MVNFSLRLRASLISVFAKSTASPSVVIIIIITIGNEYEKIIISLLLNLQATGFSLQKIVTPFVYIFARFFIKCIAITKSKALFCL